MQIAGHGTMAFKNWLTLSALVFAFSIPGYIIGQTHVPSARFRPVPQEEIGNTSPFAEPGVFDYDAQIFAPLEFTNGKELGPRTGFFATFDRGSTNLSTDSDTANSNYGPTNRYVVGWMTDVDNGWEFVYEQTKANAFLNGQDDIVTNPMLVRSKFANVEANRVFRQSLRSGAWVEPYVGFRFMNMNDTTIEDSLNVVFNGVTGTNRFRQNFSNNAAGAHVGGRYNQRRGRWRITTDIAVATTYNNQSFRATDIFVDGTGNQSVFEIGESDEAFLPALDLRFEVGYNLTRDFGLRAGAGMVYLWDGITRANTLNTFVNPNSALGSNDDVIGGLQSTDLVAAGFTLGFEWRR